MKFIKNKKKDKGYAILFTVIIVGIVSMITIGLSNAAYKQIILSSVAKDSTTAFYQADIASECALFADNQDFFRDDQSSSTFRCAGNDLNYIHSTGSQLYQLVSPTPNSPDKCFSAKVTRIDTNPVSTKIEALGYNICDKNNIRTVERAIQVSY